MSIIDAVLVYAGIPVAVVLLIYGAVYAGSARRGRRYRPGRPFEFRPVWFLSVPDRAAVPGAGHAEIEGGATAAALPAGQRPAEEEATAESATQGTTGGASDRW